MQLILLAPLLKWLFCSIKVAILKESYLSSHYLHLSGEDCRPTTTANKEPSFDKEIFVKKHHLEWLENQTISLHVKMQKLHTPTTSSIRSPQLSAGGLMHDFYAY
jgi:hypothetical protein